MGVFQLTKNIDLFSQPFSFYLGKDNKKKSTLLGGLLSFSIIVMSLAYLIYLLNLYFNNKFIPKVTQSQFNESGEQKMTFESSLFAFQIYNKDKTLQEVESLQNKKYLFFNLKQASYEINGSNMINIPLIQCDNDSHFAGFMCMDLRGLPQKVKSLEINPKDLFQSSYELFIQECQGLANCATKQEINDFVSSPSTILIVKVQIVQFNQTKQEFEINFKTETLFFDSQLAVMSNFNLQRQQTQVDTGLILQTSEKNNHVVGYQKADQYFSMNTMLSKVGYEVFAKLSFQFDQIYSSQHIQYPLITEVLAQFLSVFNILAVFGFIAKIVADSQIIEDFSNIILKEYYKSTALKLIGYKENNKQVLATVEQDTQVEVIKKLQDKINRENFTGQQQKLFKINIFQRAKILILKIFSKTNKKEVEEQSIYRNMIKEATEQIDIYELYKDLLQLKMAIRLILTKEQYAAIQFCGSDLKLSKEKDEDEEIPLIKLNQVIIKPVNLVQNEQSNQPKPQVAEKNIIKTIPIAVAIQAVEGKKIQDNNGFEQLQSPRTDNNLLQKEETKLKEEIIKKPDQQVEIIKKENTILQSVEQNSQKQLNHLTQIEEMNNNQNLLHHYLKQFINNIQNNQQQSHIDFNIYSSLIGK